MKQRFLMLNKAADWADGFLHNLQITSDGLTVPPKDQWVLEKLITKEELSFFPGFVDVVLGENQRMYILDTDLNLWQYDVRKSEPKLLFKKDTGIFTEHSMIEVSKDLLIIADPKAQDTLKAVSLENGQLVWALRNARGIPIFPICFAVDGKGNVVVLAPLKTEVDDSGKRTIEEDGALMLISLDLSGRLLGDFTFETPEKTRSKEFDLLRHQYFLKIGANRKLYLLDCEQKMVKRYFISGCFEKTMPFSDVKKPYYLEIDDQGILYIGDLFQGKSVDLNHRNIKVLGPEGEDMGRLPAFGGKLKKIMAGLGRMFVMNDEEHFITVLKRNSNFYETGESGLSKGVFISGLLDSGEGDTLWHKYRIDAYLPKDTKLSISYFACDEIDITTEKGKLSLRNFLKDDSIDMEEKLDALNDLWSKPVINVGDGLLFDARGRYLCLKVEFTGGRMVVPVLKSIKVVFPRNSFIRYLPAVYRQEENNRDFLERFLAIFETLLMDMEDKIDQVSRHFDIGTADAGMVRWVARWLGIKADAAWDEERLRKLVACAPELYKRRGTVYAISKIIEIFTGERPLIVEQVQVREMENNYDVREIFVNLYGNNVYVFYVLLKPWQIKDDEERQALEKIVNSQKPAHTEAVIMTLRPWIYLDQYNYLGVNTYLLRPTELVLADKGRIPYNSLLLGKDSGIRLDRDARMDMSVKLS
ncbi:MAG: phage tail protein [Clostridia bacterium]|nr:phage tail protein [Clostridia bacterium]